MTTPGTTTVDARDTMDTMANDGDADEADDRGAGTAGGAVPQVPAQEPWAPAAATVRASGGLAERLAQLLVAAAPPEPEPEAPAEPEPAVDPVAELSAAVAGLQESVVADAAASAERDDTLARGLLDLAGQTGQAAAQTADQGEALHAALGGLDGRVADVRTGLGELADGLRAQLADGLGAHGERVDAGLAGVHERLTGLAGEVAERTEQVHGDLGSLRDDLAATAAELAGMRALIAGNAAELGEDLASMTAGLTTSLAGTVTAGLAARFDGLDERLTTVDGEVATLRAELRALVAELGGTLEERLGARIDEAVFAFASTILPVLAQRT